MLKLAPDELVKLAPKLKSYLRSPDPAWPDVVEAAAFLRSDLGVSKSLWGDACLAMGREKAAIAIAIVSTKDPGHFRTSAGGYFHGMVAKAKAGHLNLDRTIWGMRKAKEPRPPGKRVVARAGEGRRVPRQASGTEVSPDVPRDDLLECPSSRPDRLLGGRCRGGRFHHGSAVVPGLEAGPPRAAVFRSPSWPVTVVRMGGVAA